MKQLKDKKILVTGGAGFIGFHLCKKLSDSSANVTIYDNLSSGKLENVNATPKAKFIKDDILNLQNLCAIEKSEVIFHLAAQVVVPYSMENPLEDFETNARGTLNVLEKPAKTTHAWFLPQVQQFTVIQKNFQLQKIMVLTPSPATAYPK